MGTWARGRRRGNVAAATLLKARGPGALFPRGFGFRRRGASGTLFERRADKTAVGVSRVYERAAARRRQLNYEFLQATRKIVVPATNRWALVVDTAALRASKGRGHYFSILATGNDRRVRVSRARIPSPLPPAPID